MKNEWDSIDNKVESNSIDIDQNTCEVCGISKDCVSDEGFNGTGHERKYMCHHCYSLLLNENECVNRISSGTEECSSCIHLDVHVSELECDDFSDCRYCRHVGSCLDAVNK